MQHPEYGMVTQQGPAEALEQVLMMSAIRDDNDGVRTYLQTLAPMPRVHAARWFRANTEDRRVRGAAREAVHESIPDLARQDPHLMVSSARWLWEIGEYDPDKARDFVRQGVDALTEQSRPEAVDHALWLLSGKQDDNDLGRLGRALRAWGSVDPKAAFVKAQQIEQCPDYGECVRRTAARSGLHLLPQVAAAGSYLVTESVEWLLGIVPRYMILETDPLAIHLARATDGLAHLGVPYVARTLSRIMGITKPNSEGWSLARGKLKGLLGMTPSVTTHFALLSQPVPPGVRNAVADILRDRLKGPVHGTGREAAHKKSAWKQRATEVVAGLAELQDPDIAARVLPADSSARQVLYARLALSA